MTSPNNDNELQKCADSLVRQREEKQLTTEAIAKRMRALPTAVDRFEREKEDRDFRLAFPLRYALAIGASLRLTDATAAVPDDGSNAPDGNGIVGGWVVWRTAPRRTLPRAFTAMEKGDRTDQGAGCQLIHRRQAPFVPDFWKQ